MRRIKSSNVAGIHVDAELYEAARAVFGAVTKGLLNIQMPRMSGQLSVRGVPIYHDENLDTVGLHRAGYCVPDGSLRTHEAFDELRDAIDELAKKPRILHWGAGEALSFSEGDVKRIAACMPGGVISVDTPAASSIRIGGGTIGAKPRDDGMPRYDLFNDAERVNVEDPDGLVDF